MEGRARSEYAPHTGKFSRGVGAGHADDTQYPRGLR